MKKTMNRKAQLRHKRRQRVRSPMMGSQTKPRLCVIKSNLHLYAHLINDEKGETICSISTLSKEFKNKLKRNKESARVIGEKIAEIAQKHDIKEAIFDRGWANYRGILSELADAARGAGLKI